MTDPRADDRWAKVLLDALEEGFTLQGRAGEILAANPAAGRILGLSLDELTGRTSMDPRWRVVHEDGNEWPGETHPAMEALRTGHAVRGALMGVHRPDSHLVWIEVNATPLPLEADGRPSGVVASFRDVTERVRAQALLSEARDRAEASSSAKSIFLASLSHGLRTPVTGIVGLVDLMLARTVDDGLRDLVLDVRAAADGLSVAIEDVLDLVRLEAGVLEVRREAFDLLEALERSVEVLAEPARERGVALTAGSAPELPAVVLGDRRRLIQVVVHLLEDALGSASSGEVTVRASAGDGPEDVGDGRVRIVVEGPAQDNADDALGVAIARRLVEVMGGEVVAERSADAGARVVVTLPLPAAQRPSPRRDDRTPQRPVRTAPFAGGRVLLAEDNHVNREVLSRMLEVLGLTCDTAEDGERALHAALTQSYDVVLMDVNMPLLDGLAATRALRADPRGAQVPVIALTAASSPFDESRCREAGMDGFVPKPVSLDDLRVALDPYLSPESALDLGRLDVLSEETGSVELVVDVVAMFLDELPGRHARLAAAVADGDREQVHLEAHTLRSSAEMLGAIGLARRCQAIEAMAPDTPTERLTAVLSSLDAMVEATAERLGGWLTAQRQAGSKR